MMEVLSSFALRSRLAEAVAEGQQSIMIASAYVSTAGYDWLNPKTKHLQNRMLIGRFSPTDFHSGASSFACLSMAINDGWKLGINPKLHSKVTIIDDTKIFLGSSNLTANGLGLDQNDQNESNVFWESQSKPYEIINHLLRTTQFLSYTQITQMQNFLEDFMDDQKHFGPSEWPNEIVSSVPNDERFFSSDFPDISLEDIGIKPSCFFSDENSADPRATFLNSNVYGWLVDRVANADTKYTNFGWLTKLVHNSLLDVPALYRADVKVITQLLFECVERFSDDIVIKQHQNTKSLHLKV